MLPIKRHRNTLLLSGKQNKSSLEPPLEKGLDPRRVVRFALFIFQILIFHFIKKRIIGLKKKKTPSVLPIFKNVYVAHFLLIYLIFKVSAHTACTLRKSKLLWSLAFARKCFVNRILLSLFYFLAVCVISVDLSLNIYQVHF